MCTHTHTPIYNASSMSAPFFLGAAERQRAVAPAARRHADVYISIYIYLYVYIWV